MSRETLGEHYAHCIHDGRIILFWSPPAAAPPRPTDWQLIFDGQTQLLGRALAQLRPASNDIGFARAADGRFVALLSEYDQAVGYDRAWLGRVQQLYKEKQTVAAAKAKGYIFKGKEVIQTAKGPQIRLQFVTR